MPTSEPSPGQLVCLNRALALLRRSPGRQGERIHVDQLFRLDREKRLGIVAVIVAETSIETSMRSFTDRWWLLLTEEGPCWISDNSLHVAWEKS